MSDSSTVAELVAKLTHAAAQRLAQDYHQAVSEPWEDLDPEAKGHKIAVAGEVLEGLGALGLHVGLKGDRIVLAQKKAAAKAAAAVGPWTGETCPNCNGSKMLRTGTCSTCQDCGTSSSCG